MSPDSSEKLIIAIASVVVTAVVGEVLHRVRLKAALKSALMTSVADRYIADTRAPNALDTAAFRLGAMQRAGVGLFKPRQVKLFIAEVIARGCTHPFKDSDLERYVPFKKFPLFVRAASERGITLSDEENIYRFLLRCSADREQKSNNEQ